jgi:hypothetical protein
VSLLDQTHQHQDDERQHHPEVLMRAIWKGAIGFGLVNIPVAFVVVLKDADFKRVDLEATQTVDPAPTPAPCSAP